MNLSVVIRKYPVRRGPPSELVTYSLSPPHFSYVTISGSTHYMDALSTVEEAEASTATSRCSWFCQCLSSSLFPSAKFDIFYFTHTHFSALIKKKNNKHSDLFS